MVHPQDIIRYINEQEKLTLTEFFGVDVRGLDRYVKPETDFTSLIMLSKAKDQGLDIVFVDIEKFFDGSFLTIIGELLNGTGPFDGAFYIEFDLAPVLLHGHKFYLIDRTESMGYGVNIDTYNLINEIISHFLEDSGKVNNGYWEEEINTISQLADYINSILVAPQKKDPWYSKLPSLSDVGEYFLVILIIIGMGIYYVCKYIYRFFRYINYLWNKPLGRSTKQP